LATQMNVQASSESKTEQNYFPMDILDVVQFIYLGTGYWTWNKQERKCCSPYKKKNY